MVRGRKVIDATHRVFSMRRWSVTSRLRGIPAWRSPRPGMLRWLPHARGRAGGEDDLSTVYELKEADGTRGTHEIPAYELSPIGRVESCSEDGVQATRNALREGLRSEASKRRVS
jgi:hypothetical protein